MNSQTSPLNRISGGQTPLSRLFNPVLYLALCFLMFAVPQQAMAQFPTTGPHLCLFNTVEVAPNVVEVQFDYCDSVPQATLWATCNGVLIHHDDDLPTDPSGGEPHKRYIVIPNDPSHVVIWLFVQNSGYAGYDAFDFVDGAIGSGSNPTDSNQLPYDPYNINTVPPNKNVTAYGNVGGFWIVEPGWRQAQLVTNDYVCPSTGQTMSSPQGKISQFLPEVSARRKFVPSDTFTVSGFGPGFFAEWDAKVMVYDSPRTDEDMELRYFDSVETITHTISDTDNGPEDGVFQDDEFRFIKKAELSQDADGLSLTSSLTAANYVIVTKHDGQKWIFEVIRMSEGGSKLRYGRLVQIKLPNGHFVELTYKYGFDPVHPDRQWIIDKITDPYGAELKMIYDEVNTVSGRYVIDEIRLPSYSTNSAAKILYEYGGNFLEKVTYPDGSEATYTYTEDTQTGQSLVDWFEPASANPLRREMSARLNADFLDLKNVMLNEPKDVVESLTSDTESVFENYAKNPQPLVHSYRVQHGSRVVVQYDIDSFTRRFHDGWTTNGDTYAGYQGSQETKYEKHNFTFPPGVSGNPEEKGRSNPISIVTAECTEHDLTYDDESFLTEMTYDDQTTEEWSYDDDFKHVTRYKDREDRVTKYTYDSNSGNLLTMEVGLTYNSTTQQDDQDANAYAVYHFTYNGANLIETIYSPLNTAQADPKQHRTDFVYNAGGRLIKIVQAADEANGTRPETQFEWSDCKITKSIDPESREVAMDYDDWDRLIQRDYDDGSSEQILYSDSSTNDANLIAMEKDRGDVVTEYTWDAQGRATKVEVGSHTDDDLFAAPVPVANSDPSSKLVIDTVYESGSLLPLSVTRNGERSEVEYDYRDRVTKRKVYTHSGATLEMVNSYNECNRLDYTTDLYDRRTYYHHRDSDAAIIRIVEGMAVGDFRGGATTDQLVRLLTENAEYRITDLTLNSVGEVEQITDPRGIISEMKYDVRGRVYEQYKDVGVGSGFFNAKTLIEYDKNSNVTSVWSPRSFDTADPELGDVVTALQYNGREMLTRTIVAPNDPAEADTSMTYYLDGRANTMTDPRSNDWQSFWDSETGRYAGSLNPAGHGSFVNTDYRGDVTHSIQVGDRSSHTDPHNPLSTETYREVTMRRDHLRRVAAQSVWLVEPGIVDANDVPIAGLYTLPKTDGMTTRYLYDENLTDDVGLDSTTGVAVAELGSSTNTFNVSIDSCLTKLADTTANGGASISFAAFSDGSAIVRISPEDELSVVIFDGLDRPVMQASIEAPGTLVTWSCRRYDDMETVSSITGFGNALTISSIDAVGGVVKQRSDGAGRVLETEDQLGKISEYGYDASGNLIRSRDPNGVGQDCVFDKLNRMTSCTDTWGDTVSFEYDLGDNITGITDARNNSQSMVYDARNRLVSTTDRLNGVTVTAYDANSNVISLTDAQGKVTTYGFDNRNLLEEIVYPDHVTGKTYGDVDYGKVEFTYDKASRLQMRRDQLGDTMTLVYDLGNRLTQRDYRLNVNSPSGTIADSDTFTFDNASRMITGNSGRYANTIRFAYDSIGRMETETLELASRIYPINYEYDDANRLKKLTYPDGITTEKSYTQRWQLHETKYNSSVIETRTYDDGMRLLTCVPANGRTTTYTYREDTPNDKRDNLIDSISITGVTSFDYTYDANKNRLSEIINGGSGTMSQWSFGDTGEESVFDADDRLTEWKRKDNGRDLTWSLSLVGDWNSQSVNGTGVTRTYNNVHELTDVGGTAVVHDVKGNLTEDDAGQQYEYDFDNRLRYVDIDGDGTDELENHYDVFGRRVAYQYTGSGWQDLVYAGPQLMTEYPRSALMSEPRRKYVYGSYIDEPIYMDRHTTAGWSQFHFHRNAQMSIVALTFPSGTVRERYAYDAYGNTTILAPNGTTVRSKSSFGNPWMFTGRFYDSDISLYDFRARWYGPSLGQFQNRDPIGYHDGMSLYRGYFAPQGLDPWGNTVVGGFDDPYWWQLTRNCTAAWYKYWWVDVPVGTFEGAKSIATGEAGRALGDRTVEIVERRTGKDFSGTPGEIGHSITAMGGELLGTNKLVEGISGRDLASEQVIDAEERLQRGLIGASQVASLAAGGAGLAARAAPASTLGRLGGTRIAGRPRSSGGASSRSGTPQRQGNSTTSTNSASTSTQQSSKSVANQSKNANNSTKEVSGKNPPINRPRQNLHTDGTPGKSQFKDHLDADAIVEDAWASGTPKFNKNGELIGKVKEYKKPVGKDGQKSVDVRFSKQKGIHGFPSNKKQ